MILQINISQTNISQQNNTVHKLHYLIQSGFTKLGSLSNIVKNGFPNTRGLYSCGVYAITKFNQYKPTFFTAEEAIKNGNVIRPWDLNRLKLKWVDDADILYYGLAGANSSRSLKSRLTDLLNHSKGIVTDRGPHKGGEIIWQLQGYENFELWILPTGNPPEPRNLEEKLLKQFFQITGRLPFANRKF